MPDKQEIFFKDYITRLHIYEANPDGCFAHPLFPRSESASLQSRRVYTNWNDPVSRPMPDDLIANQTGLGIQLTQENNTAYVLYPGYARDYSCCGYKIGYVRWYGVTSQVAPLSMDYPLADWSLNMRLKIKDLSTNLGQSLVEYRQTTRMFGQFARAVHDGWKLMHGRLPKRRRPITPCTLASAQLMNSYGIQPLASDLFESYEILMDRLKLPIRKRFIVTRKESSKRSDIIGSMRYEERRTTSNRAIVWVTIDPEVSALNSGIGNPAELIWEVIPFSFVVDWAIPIGDTLASLDALRGVTGIKGTLTTKLTRVTKGWLRATDIYGNLHESKSPGSGYERSHSRIVINSIPMPPFPSWDPSRSWKTVANGIALLTAVNKRCR